MFCIALWVIGTEESVATDRLAAEGGRPDEDRCEVVVWLGRTEQVPYPFQDFACVRRQREALYGRHVQPPLVVNAGRVDRFLRVHPAGRGHRQVVSTRKHTCQNGADTDTSHLGRAVARESEAAIGIGNAVGQGGRCSEEEHAPTEANQKTGQPDGG